MSKTKVNKRPTIIIIEKPLTSKKLKKMLQKPRNNKKIISWNGIKIQEEL